MSWMQTYTGGKFYVLEPEKTDFNVQDIAHALSNICRFGGHTRKFYSVAQHSVMVSSIVKSLGGTPLEQLWALMHDATEAYMGDVPTPLKGTLEGYREREDALMLIIADRLSVPAHGEASLLPAKVKKADRIALVTEARQLTRDTSEWGPDYHSIPSHDVKIRCWGPKVAEATFLYRYRALVQLVKRS